jgi:hypothetical protein
MAGPFSGMEGPFVTYQKPAEFVIMPLDSNGKENQAYGGKKTLQYWPETIDTSQSSNWQSIEIPGSPLPLKQWTSGGDHTISFSVTFSRDIDGEIGKDVDEDKFNVDIEGAIAWLRMLGTLSYETVGDSVVSVAPPVLWLFAPKVLLGVNWAAGETFGQSQYGFESGGNGIYVHLDEVAVSRMNWFQTGNTRYANLPLSFSETMQIGGGIYPYSAKDFRSMADRYTRKP